MRKKYVLISLVTRDKISKEPSGRQILSLFYEKYPLLAPQTANFYEPVNNPVADSETALEYWEGDPGLYRRKNTVSGSWYIKTDGYGKGIMIFEYNWNNKIDWFQLFQELVTRSKAYFGYVHVFTENEREGAGLGSAVDLFLNGVSSMHLKKGIPQLGWGHYFGEEYVKELDLLLLKEHGLKIEPLGNGYVFNLTDHLSDVIDDYESFNERRKLIKSLFRPGLFQNYAKYEHES
ncbi:MAG: hypothetical protein ACTHJ4_07180 [Candidatus Nucleicultricaceae bacterium]